MEIKLNIDDLSKYLSDEDLKKIVEDKISEIVQKHYEDSFSKMVYERIDNAISLLITEKIADKDFENKLKDRAFKIIPLLKTYEIFNYDYDTGKPKNEPAKILDKIFDDNLKNKLRRKLIKCANQKVKSVTKDDIIYWTSEGINNTIAELFKQKEIK
jgi:hypothetical protein